MRKTNLPPWSGLDALALAERVVRLGIHKQPTAPDPETPNKD